MTTCGNVASWINTATHAQARARALTHIYASTNTHTEIRNTYCFSTKMVSWTRLKAPPPPFSLAGVSMDMNIYCRGSSTEKKFAKHCATPIRNQQPFSYSWAHSSIAMLRCALLLRIITRQPLFYHPQPPSTHSPVAYKFTITQRSASQPEVYPDKTKLLAKKPHVSLSASRRTASRLSLTRSETLGRGMCWGMFDVTRRISAFSELLTYTV